MTTKKMNLVINTEMVEAPPPVMQTFTTNIGKGVSIRYEKLEGRDYMVVPMVMLTEGVHAGSRGPLYYPKEELAKTPAVWNHKPVVVYHPTMNGQATSACEPTVISRRKVGLILNTKYVSGKKGTVGKLTAEAWLETNALKRVDDRVLNAIKKGEMVEVSTGLFTDNDQTEGKWGKEDYESIARNYRPDHLAILPDEKGACSIADGAGLLRNSEVSHSELRDRIQDAIKVKKTLPGTGKAEDYAWVRDVFSTFAVVSRGGKHYKQGYSVGKDGHISLSGSPEEVTCRQTYVTTDGKVINTGASPMTKTEMIDALIENKSATWDDGDREFLVTLSEDRLEKFLAINGIKHDKRGQDIADEGGDADDDYVKDGADQVKPHKGGKKAGSAMNKGKSGKAANDTKKEPKETAKEEKDDEDDVNNQALNSEMSTEEYIANAPESIREVLNNSLLVLNSEKAKLITAITSNKNNRFTKDMLASKQIDELQAMAALAKPTEVVRNTRNFTGLGDVGGNGTPVTEEPLALPVMNFERKKK